VKRLARILPSAALLLLTLLASNRAAVAASESTCVNGGQQNPDIAAAKTALQRSPTQLGKRMELANLLEKAGCPDEAVHLLEEGQKYNPFNPLLLFSLRRARNMVKEEHYLEGIEQAEAGARLNRKIERCTREREIAACDELKALQSQRQALLKRCTGGDGDGALLACKSVLVKGDIDQQIKSAEALARTESTIHKERPIQATAVNAEAEAMVQPENFTNLAEATRSN
jgi:hypothetical protein